MSDHCSIMVKSRKMKKGDQMSKTMTNRPRILSKSRLMTGLQCEKALWLSLNKPDLMEEVGKSQQLQFDEGNEVGELARELEGKGTLIDNEHWDLTGAATKTQEYLSQGKKLIFEAAFLKNNLYARADILKKTKIGWELIEVKKATSVKDCYISDCAVQTIIIESTGLKIQTIKLRHVNNKMVYPDFSNYFSDTDITAQVRMEITRVQHQIEKLKKVLASTKEPKKEIGSHCSDPYGCPFIEHCWKHVPDYSIFDLPKLSAKAKWELYNQDVLKISDLKAKDYDGVIERAIIATKSKKVFTNPQKIAQEVSHWQWPLYFFDFETVNPALPRFKGMSPYNKFPFQFSCHVWKSVSTKKLDHHEFLHTEKSDPRKILIEKMLSSLGTKGSIVAYNQSFEIGVIKELAEFDKKNRKPLLALIERFVDPLPIFRAHVYHRDFKGSFSIKSVAPALIGDKLSYDSLDIADGGAASSIAIALMAGQIPDSEREKVIRDLLVYCKQDTFAMVEIVKWLMNQASQ